MSHEVTKMNIDNNYTSESVISANNTPLSENEKSLDELVQQNINVKLNVAKVKVCLTQLPIKKLVPFP